MSIEKRRYLYHLLISYSFTYPLSDMVITPNQLVRSFPPNILGGEKNISPASLYLAKVTAYM